MQQTHLTPRLKFDNKNYMKKNIKLFVKITSICHTEYLCRHLLVIHLKHSALKPKHVFQLIALVLCLIRFDMFYINNCNDDIITAMMT